MSLRMGATAAVIMRRAEKQTAISTLSFVNHIQFASLHKPVDSEIRWNRPDRAMHTPSTAGALLHACAAAKRT